VPATSATVPVLSVVCHTHPYPGSIPRADVEPADPRVHRSDVSPELAAFLLKSCAPYRTDRFISAAEMRASLQGLSAS